MKWHRQALAALFFFFAALAQAQTPPAQAIAAGQTNPVLNETWSSYDISNTGTGSGFTWYNPGAEYYDSPAPSSNITIASNILSLKWNSGQTGTPTDTTIGTMSTNGANYKAWTPPFYIEVSMAASTSTGSWPGIWMDGITNVTLGGSNTTFAELDIFEWQSNSPTLFNGTIHTWNHNSDTQNNNGSNTATLPGGTNLNNYHTYGVLVTATNITWYFDNQQMLTASSSTYPAYFSALNSQANYLMLETQFGCNWTNTCSGGASSLTNTFQWVHVFQGMATLAAPTFSPGAGTYSGTQSVTISGPSGAKICYTTDGSTPTATTAGTCSHGTTYSSAVSVATSETLNAIATEAGYTNSSDASAAYTINNTPSTTINWTNVHQSIDGFGGSNAFASASMSTANQNFFFGTGSGQLGLSILRVGIADNGGMSGSCTTVNSGCAGPTQGDEQAVVANGGVVVGSPWSPPAAYKSNGSVDCSSGDHLLAADYGAFATWLANWVKSTETYASVTPYGVSVQNEPDSCSSYDTAIWTGATLDTFIAGSMEPAWSSNGITGVKIMFPEPGIYSQVAGGGTTFDSPCNTDASCYPYIGVINWHDYDATISGTNTVNTTPFPSNWTHGTPRYWETEASCPGSGGMACGSGESSTITDALNWGAVVDDRLVNENANAWMYWWLQSPTTDAQGLMDQNGVISPRAYMLGQYAHFIRPGMSRIDATHSPTGSTTVSAYQNGLTNTIAIVATNYGSSAQTVQFNMTNAPTFTSVTPTITSSSQSMATLSSVSVSGNTFSYTLPAQSIVTFSGTASGGSTLSNPTLSPNPGSYYPSVTVSISASSGATICYTTDGTTPTATTAGTCSHGTTYSSSFVISTTSTVKALATEASFTNSGVTSGTYTIAAAPSAPTNLNGTVTIAGNTVTK